jgi:vacuolar-type H+-ATPase subunit E/Vma4
MKADLIGTLDAKVATECEEIAAQAEREANAIIANAEGEVEHERDEAIGHETAALAFQERRAKMVAESEAERRSLAMKQVVVDKALRQAQEELQRLAASGDGARLIEALLASAMDAAPEEAVVTVPEAQLEACQAWLKANGHERATVEGSKTLTDGVSVRDRAHTYRVLHTLSSRYEKLEREARKRCLRRMFGEGS